MSEWPASHPLMAGGVTISAHAFESLGQLLGASSWASAAWPTANLALFIPIRLSMPFLLEQFVSENGAAVSGNTDMGLYDEHGVRLISTGSTAQAGTSAPQLVNVADTLIGPGVFYLAQVFDNTTATVLRHASTGTVAHLRGLGMLQQASAFPLPAVATFAAIATLYIPLVGILTAGRTAL